MTTASLKTRVAKLERSLPPLPPMLPDEIHAAIAAERASGLGSTLAGLLVLVEQLDLCKCGREVVKDQPCKPDTKAGASIADLNPYPAGGQAPGGSELWKPPDLEALRDFIGTLLWNVEPGETLPPDLIDWLAETTATVLALSPEQRSAWFLENFNEVYLPSTAPTTSLSPEEVKNYPGFILPPSRDWKPRKKKPEPIGKPAVSAAWSARFGQGGNGQAATSKKKRKRR